MLKRAEREGIFLPSSWLQGVGSEQNNHSGRKEILLEGVRALPWRKANPTCQSFGRVSERSCYTNHIKGSQLR